MAKPIVLPIWDTTQINSTEPDATHKSEGWLAPGGVPEKPPMENFNFWQNNVYLWLKEINQDGVLGWDSLTTYEIGNFAKGSDNRLYYSLIAANLNNTPVGDAVNWSPSEFLLDGSVPVSKLSNSATVADNVQKRLAKAWVNFNGTGVVAIRASFNVSSITDNNTGDYTVNFINNLSDANYGTSFNPGAGAPGSYFSTNVPAGAPTVAGVRVISASADAAPVPIDVSYANIIVHGN